jgi:hypothetical protein
VFSHYCDAIFLVYLVQGDGQTGEIPGSPVLTVVLALGRGLGADRSFFASERCAEYGIFCRIQPSARRLMAEGCLSSGNECERAHVA